MRHRVGFNRLDRKQSHRKALLRNMATSLLRYERIETTKAKAKEVRKVTEKFITRAKTDSVHNRRIVAKDIKDKAVLNKLFTEIAPMFSERQGGYTRILKLGLRKGDAAEVVIIELVEKTDSNDKKEKASKKKETKAAKKPVEEKNIEEAVIEEPVSKETSEETSNEVSGEEVETEEKSE